MGPIDTLMALNKETRRLLLVEAWIREARIVSGTNQFAQLELDRKQTEIDEIRADIEETKKLIASSN